MKPDQNLPSPWRGQFVAYWADLSQACEQQQISLPPTPEFEQTVARVFIGSDYIARAIIQDPKLLIELFTSNDILRTYSPDHYQKNMAPSIMACENETLLMSCLRYWRRREMIRIIWRDLSGMAKLEETLTDLSLLADSFLNLSLSWLQQQFTNRYGVPLNSHGQAQQLFIIAVGKLGGRELNISSDIDLIFAYPEDGPYERARFCYTVDQYFTKQAQALIRLLNTCNAEGFVYRVDMRLRPQGDSGPLVMSLNGLETYYQQHGREWERYALTKARVINPQAPQASELRQIIHRFVFRRYLDYGIIEALRELKQLISHEVKTQYLQHNIKRGPGGIREIEFIEQSIRLMRGGQDKFLRNVSLLTSYHYIKQQSLLPASAVDELVSAYRFLRQVEHCLQAYQDQQTQMLPHHHEDQLRLCFSLGLPDWPSFLKQYHTHQQKVEQHFADMIAKPDVTGDEQVTALSSVWLQRYSKTHVLQVLNDLGFGEAEEIWQCLQQLRQHKKFKRLSATANKRLNEFMPLLLHKLRSVDAPLAGLKSVLRLIDVIMLRSSYIVLLSQHPALLNLLLDISQHSPWLYQRICWQPALLDELIAHDAVKYLNDKQQLENALSQTLQATDNGDLEQDLMVLLRFKQTHEFNIALQEYLQHIDANQASNYLSLLAETILPAVQQRLWQHLATKYQAPPAGVDSFMIIAYGKLGSRELNYTSDLDLVFVYDNSETSFAPFYVRLGQRLLSFLTMRVTEQALYAIDTRLRPSGESGFLVTSFNAYQQYQREQAWVWEHQALVRARALTGGDKLRQQFTHLRQEILCQQRQADSLLHEVDSMRQKMRTQLNRTTNSYFDLKQGPGGLVDIEFFIQYLVLLYAVKHPSLTTCLGVLNTLNHCQELHLLTDEHATSLYLAYENLSIAAHQEILYGKRIASLDAIASINLAQLTSIIPFIDS